jgi:glucose/arabinose dehydrogenase
MTGPQQAALSALLLAACCLLLASCGGGGDSTQSTTSTTTAPTGQGVKLTKLGDFDLPLYVTQPPGEEKDLYVVEQGGTIERLAPDGSTHTFLDISDLTEADGEQGLLSMAFSPDWERDHLFYVDYTDNQGDSRIVEYSAPGGKADPNSARELLRVDQPFPNHNGGLVLFGPDGKLYIGFGDGGDAADPDRNGLDLSTLLGKILRIDPRPDGDRPYTVPADNPFVGNADARPEIFAYGLRNPWRFSFDPDTRDLSIGDVGQDTLEEIDYVSSEQASGANFGWSAFEGDQRFNEDQPAEGAIPPVLVQAHDAGYCSITGGLVVRDPRLPSLDGRYLYGDLCKAGLRSFSPSPEEPARDDRPLGPQVERLVSFGTDNADRVYAVSIEGPVYRLDPAGGE